MDNPTYVNLTRQKALARELDTIAANLANMSTTGYRREGSVFSEYVKSTPGGQTGSLSMTSLRTRFVDQSQGALTQTGGRLDLAIEGDGYFIVETPNGERLTRAGAFSKSPENELVTSEGLRVLDEGGGPVFLPPDVANIEVGVDGTVSANGDPIGRIGVVTADPTTLVREGSTTFLAQEGFEPMENPKIAQGFLEGSNVNPIIELTRMIEVQRAYEAGRGLTTDEDERIQSVIDTLGRPI